MLNNKSTDDRFNSYFQFIRPARPDHRSSSLKVDTDPLGITYNHHPHAGASKHDESYYSDIFRELNYPHDKHRRRPSSPTAGVSNPSLSPSPSSSTSSTLHAASPVRVPRNKCHLTRRRSSLASPPLSAQSWDHVKSPAASFLASFASPVVPPVLEEEDGDEIDEYVLEHVIGYGGFSTVRRGYSVVDGHKVAIKIIKTSMLSERELENLERELAIWKSLDHPHIVQVEKILETDHAMYIVCTYCGNGSLLYYRAPSLNEAAHVFRQLCEAVAYLHTYARVCHKDIKLENVLLDENNQVKLCDFGLAVYEAPTRHSSEEENDDDVAGGSLAYASPEQVVSPRPIPSPSSDMWSLGVLLYALVSGQLPFRDVYDVRLQQQILKGDFVMPDCPSEVQDLLRHLLCKDPEERFTIQQVLQSSWLNF